MPSYQIKSRSISSLSLSTNQSGEVFYLLFINNYYNETTVLASIHMYIYCVYT